MPQFQPCPMVVIRNQLLAFMVLNLLSSCVPISNVQPVIAAANPCCSHTMPAATVLTRQIKLNIPKPHSC